MSPVNARVSHPPHALPSLAWCLWRDAARTAPIRTRMTFLGSPRRVLAPVSTRLEASIATAIAMAVFLIPLACAVLTALASAGSRDAGLVPATVQDTTQILVAAGLGATLVSFASIMIQHALEIDGDGDPNLLQSMRLRRAGGALEEAEIAARLADLANFIVLAADARASHGDKARRIRALHASRRACGGLEIAVCPDKPDPLQPICFELFFDPCTNGVSSYPHWEPLLTDDFADTDLLRGIATLLSGGDGPKGIARWLGHASRIPSLEVSRFDEKALLSDAAIQALADPEIPSAHARLRLIRQATAA